MPAEPERDQLPDQLADRAAGLLMAVAEPERGPVLDALIAEHPQHREALARLREELAGADRLLAGTWPDSEHATHIGGHRVLRRLGEGAFGIVFLCAQEQPVVRQVAIKVLRPGAGDAKTLRRFAAERQLLATLNHPAITQVYDAGALPDGRPFFVMEYVDGTQLCRYCDDHGLSCQQRLRLFIELCHGVVHAHKRGIVHRDLKPQNVLVTANDRGPMPKIIDFGIAKALFASEGPDGPRTDAGRVIGTPGYMSPEQAAGRTDEIDERADVFALGVMLYELLTGELPWARGAAATDTEPVRPSVRVSGSTAAAPAVAPNQRKHRAAELRGDLDWITLRALARERSERYQTVTALGEDIERHLRGEPVSVGPPTASYRLRKFVRRNRTLVATVAGAAVLLGAGTVLALAYGRSADAAVVDARKAAAASSDEATAMVARLLERANDPRLRDAPRADAARQVLIEDALSYYARFLEERPEDPKLRIGRCKALLSLSEVHRLVGQPSRAGTTAQEAGQELEALLAADPQNLELRGLHGEALRKEGRALILASSYEQALPKLAAAVQELAACAAIDPRQYGRSHIAAMREAFVAVPMHRRPERITMMREAIAALDLLRKSQPQIEGLVDDHVVSCFGLAQEVAIVGKLDEADRLLALAEADLPAVVADQNYHACQIARQRGRVAWDRNDRPGAVAFLKSAVTFAADWQREQPQRQRPQEVLAQALRALGQGLNYTGAFTEAFAAYRSAIARWETMQRDFPDNPTSLVEQCQTLREFARVLWDRFRREELVEAKACAARAAAVKQLVPATSDTGRDPEWQLLAMQAGIGESLGEDAGPLWQQVEATLPADAAGRARQEPTLLIEAIAGLARFQVESGRGEAAAANLALARELIARNPGDAKLMVAVGWLEARLAVARGDHAEAAAAAGRIQQARSTWFGLRRAADCLHLAFECARAAGVEASVAFDYRRRSAELYGKVIEQLREDVMQDPDDPWYVLPWGFASVRAAEFLAGNGDTASARELLDAALPKLEAVRASSHADQWDEQRFRDGQALQQRVAGNGR